MLCPCSLLVCAAPAGCFLVLALFLSSRPWDLPPCLHPSPLLIQQLSQHLCGPPSQDGEHRNMGGFHCPHEVPQPWPPNVGAMLNEGILSGSCDLPEQW